MTNEGTACTKDLMRVVLFTIDIQIWHSRTFQRTRIAIGSWKGGKLAAHSSWPTSKMQMVDVKALLQAPAEAQHQLLLLSFAIHIWIWHLLVVPEGQKETRGEVTLQHSHKLYEFTVQGKEYVLLVMSITFSIDRKRIKFYDTGSNSKFTTLDASCIFFYRYLDSIFTLPLWRRGRETRRLHLYQHSHTLCQVMVQGTRLVRSHWMVPTFRSIMCGICYDNNSRYTWPTLSGPSNSLSGNSGHWLSRRRDVSSSPAY